ncbi:MULTISPECIES: hypothetical protein [unclassified Mesorhizobium]|uniref:hypothetical protein n=1 Tax=unclassified Mesorhizobium TaxID=325217 RepID=UPI001FE00E02|nr:MULTISPECIES: hypothetical protein [unclassified Mesorhizobium]
MNNVDCAAAVPTESDVAPINDKRRREEVRTPGECTTANTTATRRLVQANAETAAGAIEQLIIC